MELGVLEAPAVALKPLLFVADRLSGFDLGASQTSRQVIEASHDLPAIIIMTTMTTFMYWLFQLSGIKG